MDLGRLERFAARCLRHHAAWLGPVPFEEVVLERHEAADPVAMTRGGRISLSRAWDVPPSTVAHELAHLWCHPGTDRAARHWSLEGIPELLSMHYLWRARSAAALRRLAVEDAARFFLVTELLHRRAGLDAFRRRRARRTTEGRRGVDADALAALRDDAVAFLLAPVGLARSLAREPSATRARVRAAAAALRASPREAHDARRGRGGRGEDGARGRRGGRAGERARGDDLEALAPEPELARVRGYRELVRALRASPSPRGTLAQALEEVIADVDTVERAAWRQLASFARR